VQAEYPPAEPDGGTPGRLSEALRDALRASDRSVYQIAQDAGVAQIVVSRFLSGERDIRMAHRGQAGSGARPEVGETIVISAKDRAAMFDNGARSGWWPTPGRYRPTNRKRTSYVPFS
jgi:hypothetical protein